MNALPLSVREGGSPANALPIFDSVPAWAIAHAANDDSTAPLIRRGEVVVVESDGCPGHIPEEGRLYLIEWVSPPHLRHRKRERRSRAIIRASVDKRGSWWARPHRSRDGAVLLCSDGPYADRLDLAEKLLGPVVGIYRPH